MQSVERTFQITRADKDLLAKQEYDVQVGFCKVLSICNTVSILCVSNGNLLLLFRLGVCYWMTKFSLGCNGLSMLICRSMVCLYAQFTDQGHSFWGPTAATMDLLYVFIPLFDLYSSSRSLIHWEFCSQWCNLFTISLYWFGRSHLLLGMELTEYPWVEVTVGVSVSE